MGGVVKYIFVLLTLISCGPRPGMETPIEPKKEEKQPAPLKLPEIKREEPQEERETPNDIVPAPTIFPAAPACEFNNAQAQQAFVNGCMLDDLSESRHDFCWTKAEEYAPTSSNEERKLEADQRVIERAYEASQEEATQ